MIDRDRPPEDQEHVPTKEAFGQMSLLAERFETGVQVHHHEEVFAAAVEELSARKGPS
jgi:hypothetical protein